MLTFVVDPIPCGGFQVRRTSERRIGSVGLPRAGQDYDFVFEVARDVGEQIREVLMRAAPIRAPCRGVNLDLQDSVAVLQLSVLVVVCLLVQFDCHR
jgi:hypothetical protein